MNADPYAFKVIDASGKEFLIFADGRIKGFGEGAIIDNRIPGMLRQARAEGQRVGAGSGFAGERD